MLKKYSLKTLQTAINHGLSLDRDVTEKLQPLIGQWLEIVIEPLGVNFFMGFGGDGVLLQDTIACPADAVIHSSPLGLIRLSLLPASKARSLFNNEIKIQGDVALGQAVKRLFDELDIDWEGHLAQFTGDIIAYQIGGLWRKGRAFGDKLVGSLHSNVSEYFHEEIRVSPCAEEIDDFFNDVDTLVLEVERIEAKINLLVTSNEID